MSRLFDNEERGRFGERRQRSDHETLILVVHIDTPSARAVRLSEHGDDAQAAWIPRSLISTMESTGKTCRGFDGKGQAVSLPLVEVTMATWKVKQEGWI